MGRLRAFLDANVLFSAALGGEAFNLLLELGDAGRIDLLSSPYCVEGARVNIERKRPDRTANLLRVLSSVTPVRDVAAPTAATRALLPDKDAPVLAAALAANADVLVTGDRTHFGPLMRRDDLGIRVRTPRDFLLDGPP